MERWVKLLNDKRFSELLGRPKSAGPETELPFENKQFRLPAERDHDRILFSTPLRRMGDKTQVFPLESIESIRTRLTHSYEVANLARSLGVELVYLLGKELPKDAIRIIPSMLAAAGLAHDIGNPPFGHQGENAIKSWFKRNEGFLFEASSDGDGEINEDIKKLTKQHKNDFLLFEGNAQTLRVLTKLQVIGDDLGLNLSVGTLASLMKYVSASDKIDKTIQARKKVGFFATEQSLVETIRKEVGLEGDSRHPLALVMEACDDIAYSVLDAEDSIKKGLVSFNDLTAHLKHQIDSGSNNDPVIKHVYDKSQHEHNKFFEQNLDPNELNDVSTQKFRVHAIHVMVSAIAHTFKEKYEEIISGKFIGELIEHSYAAKLWETLKDFDKKNAFDHNAVIEIELNGYNTINCLMDYLWIGISNRKKYSDIESERTSPFARYVYSKISRNYRRVFEGKIKSYHRDQQIPIRYREMQLLTDMVSGMTDRFCIELHNDFEKHYKEMQSIDKNLLF
ncbi:MAG: dNTP triphosphohydrolase [Magnetococcales bacterium]|nr:dNTP triphosphohydrolase [Magnetococcales bacterium]